MGKFIKGNFGKRKFSVQFGSKNPTTKPGKAGNVPTGQGVHASGPQYVTAQEMAGMKWGDKRAARKQNKHWQQYNNGQMEAAKRNQNWKWATANNAITQIGGNAAGQTAASTVKPATTVINNNNAGNSSPSNNQNWGGVNGGSGNSGSSGNNNNMSGSAGGQDNFME